MTAPAERLIVSVAFRGLRAGEIVKRLVDDYLAEDGYICDPRQVAIGPEVAHISFAYCSVARALDLLTEASGIPWAVDKEKRVTFGSPHPVWSRRDGL